MNTNPWQVDSIEAFSCLKCPECDFYSRDENYFQNHAMANHPCSVVFFGKHEEYIALTPEEYNKKFNKQSNFDKTSYNQIKVEIKQEIVEDETKLEDSELVDESYEDLNRQEEIFEDDPSGFNDDIDLDFKSNSETTIIRNHPYRCSLCNKGYAQKQWLMKHFKTVHGEDSIQFKCSICNEKFPEMQTLIEHNALVHEQETNEQLVDESLDDFKHESSSSCHDLSEEFLVSILKQVNDLCKNIKSGDPDIERTIEVNQNLNNAVTFYRSKLDLKKHILFDTDENFDIRVEPEDANEEKCVVNDSKAQEENQKKLKSPSKKIIKRANIKAASDEKENLRKLKVLELKFKGERHSERSNSEKLELVKNQCGRHQVSSMAFMLNMAKSTLHERIKKDGIIFQKRQIEYSWECQFCEMEKNTAVAKNDDLLPLLKFNQNEEKFQCSFCNFLFSGKHVLYNHLKSIHRNEINTKSNVNTKPESIQECYGSVCKKVYGNGRGKEFWCKKCSKELLLAKEMREESKAGVCPECGVLANNLSAHLNYRHYAEKQICTLCSQEFRNLYRLNAHKKTVHEKVQCTECGKLFGMIKIKGHIQAAHTPEDQKKFRCDTCGKGFIDNRRLSDHINVHTGQKPYKCKFCPSCFASRGTHAMHERGHLGCGRKLKK